MVLIAGAGIGGLTAAIALRRRGIPVRVFERAPELKPVGAGIVLAVNALSALRDLGLLDHVRAVGMPLESVVIQTPSGRPISVLPIAKLAAELGVAMLAFHRAELHEALLASLPEDILQLGAPVSGFEDLGDGVRVTLEGGERVEGALLIGADGLSSRVRRALGDEQPPDDAGQTSWRGVSRPLSRSLERVAFETWGPGLRFGAVPLTRDRAYWFAVESAPAGGRDPRPGLLPRLRERFRGWHAPIDALLAATDEDAIVRTDLFDRKPTGRWGRGRVTLLGDAAHPMTPNLGQGASQAIEDAVVLAELLSTSSDPIAALRRYEIVRQKRTAPLVVHSRRMGALAQWENPLARWLRDRLLGWIPDSANLWQARRVLLPGRR